MTRIKNALAFLAVFLLAAAGAVIPTGTALVQDALTAGQVQYADVDSLQLTLEERRQQLNIQEKMGLILNGTGAEVTSEVTKMNGAQVLETLYAQLEPYSAFGLFVQPDNDYLEFYPVMVYDEADPQRYAFCWHIDMSFDAGEGDSLTVALDDETGKILALEYIDPSMQNPGKVLWEFQDAIQAIYFGNLGLTPVEAMPIDTEGILGGSMESVNDAGDSHVMMRYLLADEQYGQVSVECCVHTNGFYIYLG